MATELTLDLGCYPPPVQVEIEYLAERTDPKDGFVQGRSYGPEVSRFRVRLVDVPPEAWANAQHAYKGTYGGALLMDFAPPDGGPARVVRFARAPRLERRGARAVTFSVLLEDAPPSP